MSDEKKPVDMIAFRDAYVQDLYDMLKNGVECVDKDGNTYTRRPNAAERKRIFEVLDKQNLLSQRTSATEQLHKEAEMRAREGTLKFGNRIIQTDPLAIDPEDNGKAMA